MQRLQRQKQRVKTEAEIESVAIKKCFNNGMAAAVSYLTSYLPYRCSLSDTTLDTMVLHSSLLVAISAHLFMFIPAYRETFPSHPHLFLPSSTAFAIYHAFCDYTL